MASDWSSVPLCTRTAQDVQQPLRHEKGRGSPWFSKLWRMYSPSGTWWEMVRPAWGQWIVTVWVGLISGSHETPCYIHVSATGEVAEWSKAQHWKCCIGATLSRVRIPPSPFKLQDPLLREGSFICRAHKKAGSLMNILQLKIQEISKHKLQSAIKYILDPTP